MTLKCNMDDKFIWSSFLKVYIRYRNNIYIIQNACVINIAANSKFTKKNFHNQKRIIEDTEHGRNKFKDKIVIGPMPAHVMPDTLGQYHMLKNEF